MAYFDFEAAEASYDSKRLADTLDGVLQEFEGQLRFDRNPLLGQKLIELAESDDDPITANVLAHIAFHHL